MPQLSYRHRAAGRAWTGVGKAKLDKRGAFRDGGELLRNGFSVPGRNPGDIVAAGQIANCNISVVLDVGADRLMSRQVFKVDYVAVKKRLAAGAYPACDGSGSILGRGHEHDCSQEKKG